VFWVISVYFNIRNTLPKSGTFLLGYPVYIYIYIYIYICLQATHGGPWILRYIYIDRASRSASSPQCACPFYSSRAGFYSKVSHHAVLSASLQPRVGSLRLLAFPKAKLAVEIEEIFECDGQTENKLSQRRLTADWLAPQDSDCSWMHIKVSSDWLPSYIKATRPVLKILKMSGYFPDRPHMFLYLNLQKNVS